MQPKIITFYVFDATPPLAIENVPAMVCQQCGEKDFSDETVAVFEQIRNGKIRPIRYKKVRIFDYEQLTTKSAS